MKLSEIWLDHQHLLDQTAFNHVIPTLVLVHAQCHCITTSSRHIVRIREIAVRHLTSRIPDAPRYCPTGDRCAGDAINVSAYPEIFGNVLAGKLLREIFAVDEITADTFIRLDVMQHLDASQRATKVNSDKDVNGRTVAHFFRRIIRCFKKITHQFRVRAASITLVTPINGRVPLLQRERIRIAHDRFQNFLVDGNRRLPVGDIRQGKHTEHKHKRA